MSLTDRTLLLAETRISRTIGRSVALNVAMSILPEGSSTDDLLVTAEDLAAWIVGGGVPSAPHSPSPPLGQPWPPEA